MELGGFRLISSFDQYDYQDKANLDYYVSTLRRIDPDILFIQESLSNELNSYSMELGTRLGLKFCMDTSGSKSYIDNEYCETMSIISKAPIKSFEEIKHIVPPFFFVGDLNTDKIDIVFNSYFTKNKLTNPFSKIITRPTSFQSGVSQDVICNPLNIQVKKLQVVKTLTDHYPIWIEF